MLRYGLLLALAISLMASGCAKKDTGTPVAPGHSANDGSGTAGNPAAGAGGGAGSTAGGGTAAGGGVAAGGGAAAGGGTAAGGGAAAGQTNKPPANLPVITQAQYDKIDVGTTVDSMNKLVGAPGRLVSESGDKKTYQYQVKDLPKHYANIDFTKGQYVGKSIFMM